MMLFSNLYIPPVKMVVSLQILQLMQGHTLAKEMVQSFWMMWLVLELRVGWLTASPIPLTTVSTVMMLESAAKLNVGSPLLSHGFCIT